MLQKETEADYQASGTAHTDREADRGTQKIDSDGLRWSPSQVRAQRDSAADGTEEYRVVAGRGGSGGGARHGLAGVYLSYPVEGLATLLLLPLLLLLLSSKRGAQFLEAL